MPTRILLLAALVAALPTAARAAEPLTLEAALAEAQRGNPDLAAARARLDQARAAASRTRAGYLPQVSAGATYTRNSEEAKLQLPVAFGLQGGAVVPTQVVEATIQEKDQLGAQVELRQAIFAPRLWFGIEASGAAARASAESAETARRELRLGVAGAFYGAASAEKAVAVQERQLEVARTHERDAQVQVEAGVAPRITLLRAQIDRARAEGDLVRARNSLASAKSALAALLGRGEAADFALAPPPAPALPADLSALEEGALRLRPELRAAQAGLEAATATRKAATAGYLPALGAFAQGRWSNVAGFTGKEESWAAGLSLSWNLLDGGAREADRREAGARIAEAEAQRAGAANRARDEVRRARLDLDSARANRAKAAEQVVLARENQRIVDAAFHAGQSTSLEATDANAALRTAELAAVNEELAADLAALRLLRAAGLDGA